MESINDSPLCGRFFFFLFRRVVNPGDVLNIETEYINRDMSAIKRRKYKEPEKSIAHCFQNYIGIAEVIYWVSRNLTLVADK